MRAIVLLAQAGHLDKAGTVHALGLGWTTSPTPTPQHVLIVFVEVEWSEIGKEFPIRAELIDKIAANVRAFYGEDPQRSPDLARIVNEQHVDRLAKLLESGTAVIGGTVDRADRYVAPTILRDVAPDAPVMQEEIFGPILPVLPVAGMDEAIAFVNARPKPLALYVFTNRQAVEDAVIARTSAGGVTVNAAIWHLGNPNLPFGGVGASGMGAYHGKHGFDAMSHWKPVLKKSWWADPSIGYPPYTKWKKALIKRFA